MPPPGQKLLPNLQGLRALAAFSVAFAHFAHDALANGGAHPLLTPLYWFLPWGAGVDIFFVISGFVIVHASAPLFGQGWRGPGVFLHRRLARIIPLYWVMTAAFLAVLWLGRADIHGDIGGAGYIAASFFFLPWARPDGVMQPAFGLGWTLNYEMFFYLVFAPFLRFARGRAVLGAALAFALLVLAGRLGVSRNPQFQFWSDPIILEFCAGMGLALAFGAGWRLPLAARLAFPLLAIAILHFCSGPVPGWRVLAYGIPAILFCASAALSPPPAKLSWPGRWLIRLGDASYAMYLVHPFVMRGFTVLWHKFHGHPAIPGTIYVLAGLATAQMLALLINATLEAKLNRLLRRKSGVIDEAVQMPGMRSNRLL